jgi:hypothetical protein
MLLQMARPVSLLKSFESNTDYGIDMVSYLISTVSGTNNESHANGTGVTAKVIAFVNKPNEAGNTALHWAAMNGHVDAITKLIGDGGADASILNKAGYDAVYEAEVNGKEDAVMKIIEEGGGRIMKPVHPAEEAEGAEEDMEDSVTMVEEGMENVSVVDASFDGEEEGVGEKEALASSSNVSAEEKHEKHEGSGS